MDRDSAAHPDRDRHPDRSHDLQDAGEGARPTRCRSRSSATSGGGSSAIRSTRRGRVGQVDTLITANELYLPLGKTVNFTLKSKDVIHSFWMPALARQARRRSPNHTNYLWYTPDSATADAWNGACVEYCGTSHANMRFKAFTVSQADFESWAAASAGSRRTGSPRRLRRRRRLPTPAPLPPPGSAQRRQRAATPAADQPRRRVPAPAPRRR